MSDSDVMLSSSTRSTAPKGIRRSSSRTSAPPSEPGPAVAVAGRRPGHPAAVAARRSRATRLRPPDPDVGVVDVLRDPSSSRSGGRARRRRPAAAHPTRRHHPLVLREPVERVQRSSSGPSRTQTSRLIFSSPPSASVVRPPTTNSRSPSLATAMLSSRSGRSGRAASRSRRTTPVEGRATAQWARSRPRARRHRRAPRLRRPRAAAAGQYLAATRVAVRGWCRRGRRRRRVHRRGARSARAEVDRRVGGGLLRVPQGDGHADADPEDDRGDHHGEHPDQARRRDGRIVGRRLRLGRRRDRTGPAPARPGIAPAVGRPHPPPAPTSGPPLDRRPTPAEPRPPRAPPGSGPSGRSAPAARRRPRPSAAGWSEPRCRRRSGPPVVRLRGSIDRARAAAGPGGDVRPDRRVRSPGRRRAWGGCPAPSARRTPGSAAR